MTSQCRHGLWILKAALSCLFVLLLSGCFHKKETGIPVNRLNLVSSPYTVCPSPSADDLAKQGIQVQLHGQTVTLMLRSDALFMPGSANLSRKGAKQLDWVVRYLRQFGKVTVKVTGYTDSCVSESLQIPLSQQQAQAVANYLWTREVDARLIYAKGMGSSLPIADDYTCKGRAMNRRIMIWFRHYAQVLCE